ncbi:ATP-dependent helicase [Planctomyces sp. SH-PL62]|uniref:ATP-dependent helicase n=1 Tax=Planctomyces sp. SH-PL62 TaxID=1636152 RepID=UPI00078D0687|nr:UvrD-helicase domain-containing protein [Planctomyces sp. SH-PL62]AMV39751.1 ATP-dependent DNA helicase PcrA [Planctomyces sp. SH-PL62]
MDLLADLTPPQREAVTHVNGPLLVLAGAGSGKTRVITRRVAHLLREGIPARNILALTFTNKAAGEMRERIEAIVPDAKVWVGTFHGFCARLLRSYGSLVGLDSSFTIYDQADRLRAVRDVLDAMGVEEPPITPEKIESAISRAKNDLATPKSLAYRARDDRDRLVAKVYAGYEEKLRAASAVDFDDLLVHVVKILKEHKDVRAELDARYRYVLVDEYQDTNMAQYAIVRALSVDHPNLCVTGDPDQSIYGWRGANLSNILEFEKDYDSVQVVKLEHNYRSTKTILAVADHLIQYNVNRKPKALITENPSGEPVQLTVYARETEEAEGVAGRIAGLVREGAYNFSDVAVFCRITALTRTFEQAFRSARIPYQIVGGVSFYERQEVKDVVSYLNLINNPKDDIALSRVVNVPPRGLGKTSFEHLIGFARQHGLTLLDAARRAREVPGLKEKAIRSFTDFVTLFDELAGLRDHPAEVVILQTMEKTGYRQHLKDESRGEGEDRLANLEELISAAREFDLEHAGATIQDFLAEITLASPVDRWDQQTGAVTLMTLHAAKGLEFPVVFIIGLEEGILPHSRAFDNPHELEEERRLFFVGITRARKELYISRCRIRTFRGQQQATAQSQFLTELPEDYLTYDDRSGVSTGDSRWSRSSYDSRSSYAPRRPQTPPGPPPQPRVRVRARPRPRSDSPPPPSSAAGPRRSPRPATSTPSAPGRRSCTPSTGWDGSWLSTGRAPTARGGSPSRWGGRERSCWPSRR